MDDLIEAGIDRVTLITGYLGKEIVDWTRGSYSDIRVDFAVQETTDGLASAVRLAEPFTDDGPTLVVLGDTLFTADLTTVLAIPKNMIAVHRVEDPSRFGVVLLEGDSVSGLVEKPSEFISDLAIVGVYSFVSGRSLMNAAARLMDEGKKTRGEFQLTDAMQLMLEDNMPFGVFEVDGWYDCGKPETLLESNREILTASGGAVQGTLVDSVVIPPVFIDEGAVVTASVIGPYVSIGRDSTIDRCVISDTTAGDRIKLSGLNLTGTILGSETEVQREPVSLNIGTSSIISI